ncbi:magnesium transporter [Cedecea neteri]|uniref:magnesium transporter n=1 Tax=Cedecea neteri TaxID=158822 RepID=UPI002AA8D9B7|nr:magnesium transporter [Cedecea neteri]WPU24580.1 magnesium transporter [Cedecea neteri]
MTFSTNTSAHSRASLAVSVKLPSSDSQNTVLAYLSQDYIALPPGTPVAQAQALFCSGIKNEQIPSQIFVVDDDGHLFGLVPVKSLLQADKEALLSDLMRSVAFSLTPEKTRHEACVEIKKAATNYIPVLSYGKLKGVLGPQEIAQLLEDENTLDSQLQGASSPLETPYLQSSVFTLWRKRSVWLLLLFVAEAYTSSVIKSFEDQLEAAIALAFFIPLLIGTGGNTGTQITSTLVRAMALGEVGLKDLGAILRKEISASVLIALTIGTAGFIRAWMLGVGMEVMMVVSLTLIAITVWSAIVSSIIPMLLRKVNIDPAVVSAPFITTLIDGTGLLIYFEIAKVMLTDLAV